MASKVQDAPSLFPEPVEFAPPPGRGLHGYYRKPDGWIVVAATTPSNRSGYEYKGFTFLPQYGEFANGTNELTAKQNARDDRGNPWNPAIEPWRLIFQRDGASAFPIDQIIAFHWHLQPPYKEVKFPQLEGVDITVYPCPECDRGVFSSINPLEASGQLRTHLTTGVNKRHEYTPTDLRELGKELEIDFDSARIGRVQQVKEELLHTEPDVDLSSRDVGAGRVTPEGPPPPCEFCEYLPNGTPAMWARALNMHKRMHCRKNPDSVWSKKQEPVLA